MSTTPTPDFLRDPQWFPLDYDARRDAFEVTRVDLDLLGNASFLDNRAWAGTGARQCLPAPSCVPPPQMPALLCHTAFCGSTLLARALHAPPASVVLKEPSVLLSLALHQLKSPAGSFSTHWHALEVALGMLGRPWAPGGRVLVKPTNQVNRLLPALLAATDQPAVLMYSSLEEFLLSCCKKLPNAETPLRWMAQFLLPGTRLQARLTLPDAYVPNFVESCVLTWYAQIERYAIALQADQGDRLRTLDMAQLLSDPRQSVQACALWLGLEDPALDLPARVQSTFSRDAKNPARHFNNAMREHEKTLVRDRFMPMIEQALKWAQAVVHPASTLPTAWKPLIAHRPDQGPRPC